MPCRAPRSSSLSYSRTYKLNARAHSFSSPPSLFQSLPYTLYPHPYAVTCTPSLSLDNDNGNGNGNNMADNSSNIFSCSPLLRDAVAPSLLASLARGNDHGLPGGSGEQEQYGHTSGGSMQAQAMESNE